MKKIAAETLPPHSLEAEAGALACVLMDPVRGMDTCIERLRAAGAAAFYESRHQSVYGALRMLMDRKEAVDLILLQEHLRRTGDLDKVGGLAWLVQLQDAAPSAANLDHYLDIVLEKWHLRRLLSWATNVCGLVYEHQGSVTELVAQCESTFEDISTPAQTRQEKLLGVVLRDKVLPLLDEHYTRGRTQLNGLPTGLNYLDKVIGGIRPDDYVVLAGRPGEGKTSLGMNIVEYLSRDYEWTAPQPEGQPAKKMRGIPVGIFSLEMSDDSLGFRMVFSRAKIPSATFKEGFATEKSFKAVRGALDELREANIVIDDDPDQSMDEIAAKARRWVREYGIKLFVLDYLQLLDAENDNDRVRVLRRISKKIVSLKKRLKVPWLVLAQMNRNIETADRARRPVLSDLKESGSIEQDADKVVFLYHPLRAENIEEDEEKIAQVAESQQWRWDEIPRRINAFVAKNRHGPTGPAQLLFANNLCRFWDWHLWKVQHNLETLKDGERENQLFDPPTIHPEDVPL